MTARERGEELNPMLMGKISDIRDDLEDLGSVLVAYSGGVDSSTVAALAYDVLGDDAYACTAVSETLPEEEYREALSTAEEIGIQHELVSFSELDSSEFVENNQDRCYHCRTMRLGEMSDKAIELGVETVLDGTNASDADPDSHRPGLQAVDETDTYSPLLENGVEEDEVREIARYLGLSVWDKPSMACLSSRIPHGSDVTEDKLMKVEQAESVLREYGFRQLRVRNHGDIARVEIARDEMDEILDKDLLMEINDRIKEVGFEYVSLDMKGYRTGSLVKNTD